MADFLSKITKFLIPEEVEEIEAKVDEKQETRRQTVKVAPNVTRVANGPSIYTNTAEATRDEATSSATNNYEENNRRPSLKVYKQPNMNVLVFEPTNFNDTRIAADALKASKAVLINYEKIEQSEQVRICDFMNGACYVLDGSVKRISAKKLAKYKKNTYFCKKIILKTER